jgi:hypothetical protein
MAVLPCPAVPALETIAVLVLLAHDGRGRHSKDGYGA